MNTTLEQTLLWKALAEKANDHQRSMVLKRTKSAANLLMLIRDSFPTYTLHNELHSLNVIDLMGKLLWDRISDLDVLESALLILSAYYHDIGMVFTDEERIYIQEEADFSNFLHKNPKAHLQLRQYQKSSGNQRVVPEEIAEWYCRWIHATRSYEHVKRTEDIDWDNYPINDALAALCKSHNDNTSDVNRNEELSIDFLANADLKFCAIILRLADILDFDNSRSPEEVYKYLGLSEKRTKRKEMSDVEWQKHLVTKGFIFPKERETERYKLKFAAASNTFAVEYDIREFLNTIENEFDKCNAILKFCSKRWQNFKLPYSIDRGDIKGKNYTFGKYLFTLEQDQILNMLMGENLYSDPYVCIRELIQNAIDTVRHREAYEKNKGNLRFTPDPVTVSSWIDDNGYRWLRIDDNGMGMDEDIIANFFLKVGKSYYQSEQFKLEQINWQTSFTPISRFGIGILSCFTLADVVEVSTRRLLEKPAKNALRMDMRGLTSYFLLQEESKGHVPQSMPNESKTKEEYRGTEKYGTSIAIRFSAGKEKEDFNLKNILNKYVLCSPVPILLDGQKVGGSYEDIILNKWAEEETIELNTHERKIFTETLHLPESTPVEIKIQPLDLTSNSPTPCVTGQAVLIYIKVPDEILTEIELYRQAGITRDFQLHNSSESNWQGMSISCHYKNEEKIKRLKNKYGGDYRRWQGSSYQNELEKVLFKTNTDLQFFSDYLQGIISDKGIQNSIPLKLREQIEKIHKQGLYNKAEFLHEIRQCLSDETDVEKIKDILIKTEILLEQADKSNKTLSEYKNISGDATISMPELTNKIGDLKKRIPERWLSHNGIYVPVILNSNHFHTNTIDLKKPITNGIFLYNIALKDDLRPDLSISRETLNNLSWNIYSAVNLTFHRALQTVKYPKLNYNIFETLFTAKNTILLGEVLNDPFIGIDKEWSHEKIIKTELGTMSLSEIRSQLKEKNKIKLISPFDMSSYHHGIFYDLSPVLSLCTATLIQCYLHANLNCDTGHIYVYNKEPLPITEPLKFYHPFFFLEYENSALLRKGNWPLNQNHPFSIWLLNATEDLHREFPGLVDQLKKIVGTSLSRGFTDNLPDLIKETNKILTRLQQVNFKNKPEKSIFLSEKDFGQ